MKKDDLTKQEKFIKNSAQGMTAYEAAVKAGYSEKYAKNNALSLGKKFEAEINKQKIVTHEQLEKEVLYTIADCYNKFCQIQEIALELNDKGQAGSIPSAVRCEEMKARLLGLFSEDNSQKAANATIFINREAVNVESLN